MSFCSELQAFSSPGPVFCVPGLEGHWEALLCGWPASWFLVTVDPLSASFLDTCPLLEFSTLGVLIGSSWKHFVRDLWPCCFRLRYQALEDRCPVSCWHLSGCYLGSPFPSWLPQGPSGICRFPPIQFLSGFSRVPLCRICLGQSWEKEWLDVSSIEKRKKLGKNPETYIPRKERRLIKALGHLAFVQSQLDFAFDFLSVNGLLVSIKLLMWILGP